jgi:PAS domain S-box-containing protein
MEPMLKILHLEDSSSDADLVSYALKKGKIEFEQLVVDSKGEYVDALKDFMPDIVLSDHSLPSFNSYEALAILQATGVKIPFILITANISEEFAVDVIKRGADDYILKDRLQRLPSAIHNALEIFRLEKERKSTENALRDSEFRYRQIVETAHEGIWMTDEYNVITFVNAKMCAILNYPKEEILGKEVFHFMTAAGKHAVMRFLKDPRKGVVENMDIRYVTKDGKLVWTNLSANPIYDEFNRYQGILAMISDISEKRNLENLLNRVNSLASIGSWEADLIKDTMYWSAITRQMHEVDRDFSPAMSTFTDFYKEGPDRNAIHHALQEAFEDGISWDLEVRLITAKGNECWVRAIGGAEFNDGQCVRLFGSFHDIDVRKKAELEVLKIYQEKNIILESIGDAFFAVDKDWIVTYWNKEAEKLLGKRKDEMEGQPLWDMFSDSVESESYKKYHLAVKTRELAHFEDYYEPLKRWYEISAYPSDNGLSVYFKDITERRLSEIRLNESENRYSDLFHLSPEPMWVFDPENFRFVQVNKAAIVHYGFSEAEFLAMTVRDIRAEEKTIGDKTPFQLNFPAKENLFKGRVRHVTKAGQLIDVDMYSNPIILNGKLYRSVIAIDVTEKVIFEYKITRAIIKTQEDERYEIGSELHDNICQLLAAGLMSISMLKGSLKPPMLEYYNQCKDYLVLATDEIRNLSHRLAPAFFDDSTLEGTFKTLLDSINMENKHSISLLFDSALQDYPLPRDVQLNLYRMLQEQLGNVLKYAHATNIKVAMQILNNILVMRISDNGVGFDLHLAKGGIGLANIRRRAELFSGQLEIETSPGNGCELTIAIPIQELA